jgi:hypothetical protein
MSSKQGVMKEAVVSSKQRAIVEQGITRKAITSNKEQQEE